MAEKGLFPFSERLCHQQLVREKSHVPSVIAVTPIHPSEPGALFRSPEEEDSSMRVMH